MIFVQYHIYYVLYSQQIKCGAYLIYIYILKFEGKGGKLGCPERFVIYRFHRKTFSGKINHHLLGSCEV